MTEFSIVPKDVRQRNVARRANGDFQAVVASIQAERDEMRSKIESLSRPQTPGHDQIAKAGVVLPDNSGLEPLPKH